MARSQASLLRRHLTGGRERSRVGSEACRGWCDATYDVFDRSAEFVGTYTLPNNKRVIGFGNGTVYVVAYDEFDLNYLERYSMPGA